MLTYINNGRMYQLMLTLMNNGRAHTVDADIDEQWEGSHS